MRLRILFDVVVIALASVVAGEGLALADTSSAPSGSTRSDPPSARSTFSTERAEQAIAHRRSVATWELIGGIPLAIAGGALTVATASPCDGGCGWRGLGLALDVPLLVGGVALLAMGLADHGVASRMEATLAERGPELVPIAEEASLRRLRGNAALVSGVTSAALGVTAIGAGVWACTDEVGCQSRSTPLLFGAGAAFVALGAVGFVVAAHHLSVASELDKQLATRSFRVVPTASTSDGALQIVGAF